MLNIEGFSQTACSKKGLFSRTWTGGREKEGGGEPGIANTSG